MASLRSEEAYISKKYYALFGVGLSSKELRFSIIFVAGSSDTPIATYFAFLFNYATKLIGLPRSDHNKCKKLKKKDFQPKKVEHQKYYLITVLKEPITKTTPFGSVNSHHDLNCSNVCTEVILMSEID